MITSGRSAGRDHRSRLFVGQFHVVHRAGVGLGFGLQDRGELFDLAEGRANSYAPGKRPFHTIIPAFITKDGKPWISFGLMGGAMQPQGHAQIVINMIDFGMPVEEAVAAPRIHLERDLISIEPGFPRESVEALVAAYPEHHLWEEKNLFFGGAHTVTFDGSRFRGAGDPF